MFSEHANVQIIPQWGETLLAFMYNILFFVGEFLHLLVCLEVFTILFPRAWQGCRSLPASHPGFVSVDDETGIRFLSHQHPRQPQLFSVVRQACVRSLSCEVNSDVRLYVCVCESHSSCMRWMFLFLCFAACNLSCLLLSGVSGPWRAHFLWRRATRLRLLAHLLHQRQFGQGLPALVQHCHGSNGQDLPHQLLAFSVTPPQTHNTEPAKHSPQGRLYQPLFRCLTLKSLIPQVIAVSSSNFSSLYQVFDNEQGGCPQRAVRMNSVFSPAVFPHQRSGNAARSLTSLTQHPNLWASLHSSFSWWVHLTPQSHHDTPAVVPPLTLMCAMCLQAAEGMRQPPDREAAGGSPDRGHTGAHREANRWAQFP